MRINHYFDIHVIQCNHSDGMAEVVTMRLPDELASDLNRIADIIDRPKSYLIRKALEEYLEEYEDYLIAMNRWNDKDDEVISSKELRDALDL
jgi:RHH-type rel operon transcriptional repressor/antitoxin RelB